MRIGRRILDVFGVRSNEVGKVAGLAANSFFIGVFCAFFFSAANALFLDMFEISALPVAYIAAGLVGYVAVMLFARLERAMSFVGVLVTNLVFLIVLVAGFWYLAQGEISEWVTFAMFVWVGPTFVLIFLGYWALAVRLFDLRQGKRLFGLVGAGEEVATVTGLFSVPFLVRYLGGPVPLLLIAVVGLIGCLVVVVVICWVFKDVLGGEKKTQTKAGDEDRPGLGKLLKNDYFLMMAGLIILLSLGHYIVDFSFLSQIRVKFQGPAQIAQFIGIFFGSVKILELVMKAFLSGRLLHQFGLKFGLMITPVLLTFCALLAIIIGSLGLEATHLFVLVALAKLIWAVMRTSMFLPSFRVFYQPVSSGNRLAFQTHVDGTAKQLATLGVGVALLLFSKGEAFNAVNLYWVLLPILILWIVLAVFLYRSYRMRLMENLEEGSGHKGEITPVDAMVDRLLQLPADMVENSAMLVARVDARAVIPMLQRMLEDPSPESTKIVALRYVEQLKALGAFDTVKRVAGADVSAAVREQASRCIVTLQEVMTLSEDPKRVKELAASPVAAQRDLAVSAIGFSSNPEAHIALTEVLWDKDRDVRRAALIAAGRVGLPAYWHRIISQLHQPTYSNAATFALITIGEPVLSEVDRSFGRAEPELQARILRIYERAGGREAQRLLLNKLDFPDMTIRRKALTALSEIGFDATEDRIRFVENEIENVIKNMAWNMCSVLDIGDDEVVSDLRIALEGEISEGRKVLFNLLSLLYDASALSLVKKNLDSGRPEAAVYALEIMDILVSPELKPMVFPVLEDLSYAQILRRLDAVAPRHRLERFERLSSIVNRQRDRISSWTRACALVTIGKLVDDVVPELMASLYHPQPLIQEVAGRAMINLDAQAFARVKAKLPYETRQRFSQLFGPDGEDKNWDGGSVLGRTEVIRHIAAFSKVPMESLVMLAASSEEVVLRIGQVLPHQREPKDSLYIVLNGDLVYTENGDERRSLSRGHLIGFAADASPIEAESESTLIRLDATELYELVTEYNDLIPVILRAGRQLVEEVAVTEGQGKADEAWVETRDLEMSV